MSWVGLFLLGLGLTSATHITLKSLSGDILSIPLEFGTGALEKGAPPWVQYEGGTLKGVAGEPGLYKFRVKEDDGTSVDLEIGVAPRPALDAHLCTLAKSFHRILSLEQKLELGVPGGFYVDGPTETVLHWPGACSGTRARRRRARQSHHEDQVDGRTGDHAEDEELGGSGSEEDDEDFEEEEEEVLGEHSVPLLPTPVFPHEPRTHLEPAEFGQSTPIISATPATPATLYTSTSAAGDTPDLYIPQELGSGDFEITPSSPLPFPTATPILQPEVTSPTPPGPQPPLLRKQVEKLLIPAGKVFKFDVSTGYFTGPNQIAYSLEALGEEALPGWVVVEDGALVAWPPQSDVSDYRVVLVAEDVVTGASATCEVVLSVRQSQKIRNYHHRFELQFRQTSPAQPLYHLLTGLQEYAGGRGEDDLVLTKVERTAGIQKILWTNESLLVGENLGRCPVEQLRGIYGRLASGTGTPRQGLTDALAPHFTPISVGVHLESSSVCGGVKTSNVTGWKAVVVPKENFQPRIVKAIDSIECVSGEFLVHKVPESFCQDVEDGETRYLTLSLLDRNNAEVGNESWIQFDRKNQEFYGLPPPLHGPGPAIEEWVLKCTDSQGKFANDALEVLIQSHNKSDYSAEFHLYFQSPSGFAAPEIRKFVTTLAKAFNDTINNIVIKAYQHAPPNVQVFWYNKTNPSTEAELTLLRRLMFTDDGPPKTSFKDLFKPEGFNLSHGQVIPKGRLVGQGTFTADGDLGPVQPDLAMEGDVLISGAAADEGTYLITYIVPSVLIAVMVLLAALIACLLTRKRKALPKGPEDSRAFIKKGVPVIFQDELEEDKGARSRSPAILREEHPPLHPPPPDYRRSPIEQYQPPPPINKSTGVRGVRPSTQSYRRPPPYAPT